MNKPIQNDETFKFPRLYVNEALQENGVIELAPSQAHYLANVLRRKENDLVRLFNGKDGEWLGSLTDISKKQAIVNLENQLLEQPQKTQRIQLIFAPIKKNRMDWLIEKAVELGTTDFYPILTQNTEVRKIKEERLKSQIFEAAEQCERLSIPKLHSLTKLEKLLDSWDTTIPILSCIERFEARPIKDIAQHNSDIALLVGPEGGFTAEEKDRIAAQTAPVSLGETILRCETAVVKALIQVQN